MTTPTSPFSNSPHRSAADGPVETPQSAPVAEPADPTPAKRPSQGKAARELNDVIRYTMWSVFELSEPAGSDEERAEQIGEVEALFAELAEQDVTVRGLYDVSGLRADADLMVWWHASTAEALQAAYNGLRRTALGGRLVPVWSQMALHRPAEFNKSHIPAFLADEAARDYICVYPFVRSYEWYLLEDAERRAMLAEHGQLARGFPDVRANTVASFALGDYEWILAFEADELHRIVDLMRHLRASTARRHVREEVPFYTGRRRSVKELLTALP
ncbi:MAG: hydrogen peroxide-dependent heme synthase [Nocardioidaceae bacterium]